MQREEQVTVQGPVKEQQPDGMSHRGHHLGASPQGRLGFQLGGWGGVNRAPRGWGGGFRKRDQLTRPSISYYELWRPWRRNFFWALKMVKIARGALLVRTRPQRGGGGDPPPLRTPKLSHGTRCFVGAGGAGDFVLGIRQGEFFLFHPMCLSSKYSEFCGEFKNG